MGRWNYGTEEIRLYNGKAGAAAEASPGGVDRPRS